MRINQGQEFVIGGYTPSTKNFDALIFGYYEGDRLLYAARTRNGFTPSLREQLYRRFRRPGDHRVPVHEPAGDQKRSLGAGPHR